MSCCALLGNPPRRLTRSSSARSVTKKLRPHSHPWVQTALRVVLLQTLTLREPSTRPCYTRAPGTHTVLTESVPGRTARVSPRSQTRLLHTHSPRSSGLCGRCQPYRSLQSSSG